MFRNSREAVTSLGPRTLRGRFIALEPLEERHHHAMIAAADDPELWRYIPIDMRGGFAERLGWSVDEMARGNICCSRMPSPRTITAGVQDRREERAFPGSARELGAKEEGILRGHLWMPQDYHRDSVYFSILAPEWPLVRAALEARLRAFA